MTQSFDDVIKTVVESNIYQQMENSDRMEFISFCVDFFKLGEGFEQSVNESLHKDLDELRKRIDEAIKSVAELIENTYNIDTMYGLENILNVLSGEENERS